MFKSANIPARFAFNPQNQRQFAQKAEEEAWKSASSLVPLAIYMFVHV
jgi:hypothetical protein